VKLTLFLYMWGDAALRGRVDGEYASVRTAFHVSVHSASAFLDGSLEHLDFPTVQECSIKAVPGSVAVGEHERLLGVQSVLCEGVELDGVPVNLDLDLGEGYRVRRICAFSVGREGNVRFVVIGIAILWGARVNTCQGTPRRDRPFRPSSSGTSVGREFVSVDECGEVERTTWDRSPPGH